MKNIFFKIMAGAALVTAFASCELNDFPAFDEADSFVAIDKTAITVDETAGKVIIPVTIASIDPVKTSVTYEVVDSTAVKTKHYRVTDESCVLAFDGTVRTQNIVVDIIDSVGVYTGDLVFAVNLLSGGKSINLGANATCIVKISDLDHPLASILGEYSCKAEDKSGPASWTLTMSKDPDDVKVVWIDYICPLASKNPGLKFAVYGNVSDDMKTISIPCGQKPGALYAQDDPFTFIWFDYDNGYQVEDSGEVVMKSETPGVWTTEDGMGFCSNDYVFNGGMILKGTAVWTKK